MEAKISTLMTRERRDSRRTRHSCEAVVFFGNERVTCRLVDLSASGLALSCGPGRSPSSFLRVHFTPPRQALPVAVDGILVRQKEYESHDEWGVRMLDPPREVIEAAHPEEAIPRLYPPMSWLVARKTHRDAPAPATAEASIEPEDQPVVEEQRSEAETSIEPEAVPVVEEQRSEAGVSAASDDGRSEPAHVPQKSWPDKWWLIPASQGEPPQENGERGLRGNGSGIASWLRKK